MTPRSTFRRRGLLPIAIGLLLAALVGAVTATLPWCLLAVTAIALIWQLRFRWGVATLLGGHDADAGSADPLLVVLRQQLGKRRGRAEHQRRRLTRMLQSYRETVAALPDAVIALDGEHRILAFNPAATTLLQFDRKSSIGTPLTDHFADPRVVDWLGSRAGGELEIALSTPGCDDRIVTLRQLHDRHGRRLLIARDVSQLHRLEQVRRDFVANVSHELRTPLTVVHGYLDMIDPEDVPEYETILRELRNQSRRMTQIVEDLLTLSRLDGKPDNVHDERVPLAPMLATLRREAEAMSKGRHVIRVESNANFALRGSVKDLHGAFSNLVSNALRYTPPGGHVTIRWHVVGDEGRFEVIDDGPGIPAQHLPRLTERFYRVSTSRSRESGGTGLGLSIVKHVLQLHDARLEIESEPGVGSTFSCVFSGRRLLRPLDAVEDYS